MPSTACMPPGCTRKPVTTSSKISAAPEAAVTVAQFANKGSWHQRRMPALHRLNQHGRNIVNVGLHPRQALWIVVAEHDHIRHRFTRNARCDRRSAWAFGALAQTFRQHFIELPVIRATKEHDLAASCNGARDAHARHHGFRASIAECCALIASHGAEHLGHFGRERRLRSNGKALFHLRRNRRGHKIRRMSKCGLTVAIDEINQRVAVRVMQLRALRALGDDRINQLFPFSTETTGRAWIGKHTTARLCARFRCRKFRIRPPHKVGNQRLLRCDKR